MATFIVNTAEDGDDDDFTQLTLREAVRRANETDGTDTIRFAEGIDFIRLEEGEIDVFDDLIIEGGTGVTISGDADGDDETETGTNITDLSESTDSQLDDNSRIFSATDAQMNLSDLVLTGGRTTDDDEDGGAIYSDDAVLLERVTLAGNETTGDYSEGGALYATQVELLDSTVRDNRTFGEESGGGGVYADHLSVTRSLVSDNLTEGYEAGGGGLKASYISISQSTISGNRTNGDDAYGGGFYADYARVADSTISGNRTTGDGSEGGGFYVDYPVLIERSIITDNRTSGEDAHGGGFYADEVVMIGTTVSGNSTSGVDSEGGGFYAGDTATIIDSTISNNFTTGDESSGGGFYSEGYSTVRNSTISGNRTEGEDAYGGGLYSYYDLALIDSTVSGNRTEGDGADGGGIVTGDGARIVNSTVANNETLGEYADGGGIYAGGFLSLTNSTVTGNRATGTGSYGGGIYADDNARITNSIVLGNSSTDEGDEIYFHDGEEAAFFVGANIVGSSTGAFDASVFTNVINASAADTFAEVENGAGVLADNGGPTQTVLILEGGLAQGTSSFGERFDQRGDVRQSGLAFDIGAVELLVPDAPTLTGETVQLAFDDDSTIRIPLSQLLANDEGIALEDLVLTDDSAGRIEGDELVIDGEEAQSLVDDTTDRDGQNGASLTVSYTVEGAPDQIAAEPAEAVLRMTADLRLAEASLAAEPGETATVDVSALVEGGFGEVTVSTTATPAASDGRSGPLGEVTFDGNILSFAADEKAPTRDGTLELSAIDALGQSTTVQIAVEVETAGGRTLLQGTDDTDMLLDTTAFNTTGNEQIEGLDGSDVLISTGGDDRMFGGEGVDRFVFARTGTATVVEVADYEKKVESLVFDDQFFGLGETGNNLRQLNKATLEDILATGSVRFADGNILVDPGGPGGADPILSLDVGIEKLTDLSLSEVFLL